MHVSVVMPCYDTPVPLLERAVLCVLNQTHLDWHLYIVDDGSTDPETIARVKVFGLHSHVSVVRQDNHGVSSARNAALDRVPQGEVAALLDSDDWWDEHYLEVVSKCMDDCDMLYSNPQYSYEDGRACYPNWATYTDFKANRLKLGNFITSSAMAFRNCGLRFDTAVDSLEDYDLALQYVHAGKRIKFLTNVLVNRTVRDGSLGARGRDVLPVLKAKWKDWFVLRLNLGSGSEQLPGYIACDMFDDRADLKWDVAKLPLQDGIADEVRAFHLIEHFNFQAAFPVLREWRRILKPGGRLWLETPDFLESCREFVNADEQRRIQLYGHFWARGWVPGQQHMFGYTENQLRWTLEQCGFQHVKRIPPSSIYVMGANGQYTQNPALFLCVEAEK
jgi:glycosyltransferase involved in cell wall biosynthesis